MANCIVFVLSLTGLAIALYFALVYYGLVRPDTRLVPRFCRMNGDTCLLVVHHPDAKVFGLPNALFGIGFYLLVLASVLLPDVAVLHTAAVVAAWISVAVATYLVHSLVFKIKTPCPLCFIAHGINILLAVAITIM